MERPHGWFERLRQTLEAHERCAFRWGEFDCCLFAARCVDAMTGTNHETQLRQAYCDEPSALRYIADAGGLVPAISRHLGQPTQPKSVSTGDVVAFESGGQLVCGVVIGPFIVVAGKDGLVGNHLHKVRARWAI